MADRRGSARTRAANPILAGLLALAFVGCAANPPAAPTEAPTFVGPSEQPTALPTAATAPPTEAVTQAPSSSSVAPACTAADLKASHDLVQGAAGSRLTSVALTAATKCSVDLHPTLGIRDAHGTELVRSTAAGGGRLDLNPDASYSTDVKFDNWCGPDPKYPLTLVIQLGPEELTVTGSSFPDVGDMPPCNGAGGPTLESGAWTVAP